MSRSPTLLALFVALVAPGCDAPPHTVSDAVEPIALRDGEPPFARAVPIRFVELHAPRHPECQEAGGTPFRGPLGAAENAWLDSEEIADIVGRLDAVYEGSDITFWLLSHDVYCTDTIATDGTPVEALYSHWQVDGDIGVLYPHDERWEFPGETHQRDRWLEKAYVLYGDPHAFTVFVHNDFVSGTSAPRLHETVLPLPQHGYYPWSSPALAVLFLSAFQQVDGWEFDTELTLAHEIGHALGPCHTIDANGYCFADGKFPDGRSYDWQDIWDLIYADMPTGPVGFESRDALLDWIAVEGDDELRLIDDECNGDMSLATGRLTLRLDYDASQAITSEQNVTSSDGGTVRLLQGLSFPFAHAGYTWQRNVMSYRYPTVWGASPECGPSGVDPYDYLTARFSTSQLEVMREQLSGSIPFTSGYGVMPASMVSAFASRFDLLGDGVTEDFVWYSNGEGPATVAPQGAFPDRIAFRSSPARALDVPPGVKPAVVDFDQDGLDDLIVVDSSGLTFHRSWLDGLSPNRSVHRFDPETAPLPVVIGGQTEVVAANIDMQGPDDLLLFQQGEPRATVLQIDARCLEASTCITGTSFIALPDAAHDVTVTAAGNLDGAFGDDVLVTVRSGRVTMAWILWSDGSGGVVPSAAAAVGGAAWVPAIGDLDGDGADDIAWHDPATGDVVLWRGAPPSVGAVHRMSCGAFGEPSCAETVATVAFGGGPLVPMTVGDFDGNGADDLMARVSDAPPVLFSTASGAGGYGAAGTLPVGLHRSWVYGAVVGEFDGATRADGSPLGDDVLLLYP